MRYEAAQLRALIQSTLKPMGLYSVNAEELLMATAANESHLGEFRLQVDGPAIGIFQEEPEDFSDLYANFLTFRPHYRAMVDSLSAARTVQDLENNDPYAVAICRMHYLRAPGDLPAADDLTAIWNYYKAHYNSAEGAANATTFAECYRRYVQG